MSIGEQTTTTVTVKPGEPISLSTDDAVRRDATVWELANIVADSRDFPGCRTPEKAAVRILAGKEMGVGPIASVIGIRVQNGRVSMDATLMAGCIKRSNRYDYKITEHTNDVCALVFFDKDQPAGESAFSMTDAKTAGLAGKDTWRNYPRNMLFARALSNGARWYCAGIFGGSVYTHEELGYKVDEEGRAIDAEAGGNGSDLCTRDQRQQIADLVKAVGDSMPGYLASVGVRLLDELSQREANKEIAKLEKRLAKAGVSSTPSGNALQTGPLATAPNARPSTLASTADPLTPAQQNLSEAYDESREPSTPEQREAIIGLAKFLVADETECVEMLKAVLAKRNCRKVAELNHLQAASLIESLQKKIGEKQAAEKRAAKEPPFDPDPAKLPGMAN